MQLMPHLRFECCGPSLHAHELPIIVLNNHCIIAIYRKFGMSTDD